MTPVYPKNMIDGGYYLCYEVDSVGYKLRVVLGRYLLRSTDLYTNDGVLEFTLDHTAFRMKSEWIIYGDGYDNLQEIFKLDEDEILKHVLLETI